MQIREAGEMDRELMAKGPSESREGIELTMIGTLIVMIVMKMLQTLIEDELPQHRS